MTDNRDSRTSGNVANAGSALIDASVTGCASFFDGHDVHGVELAGLVGRVWIRGPCRLHDADDGLLGASVIEEDAIALGDRPQVFLRERIGTPVQVVLPSRTRAS